MVVWLVRGKEVVLPVLSLACTTSVPASWGWWGDEGWELGLKMSWWKAVSREAEGCFQLAGQA